MKLKNLLTTLLFGAVVGIAIGTSIELLVNFFLDNNGYTPASPAFLAKFTDTNIAVLVERCCYALYGMISALASLVYQSKRLPIALATLIHLGIITVTGILLGAYLVWWKTGPGLMWLIAMIFVVYVLIWLAYWFTGRKDLATINEKLTEVQES